MQTEYKHSPTSTILLREFPQHLIKQKTNQDYIETTTCIDRLNEAFSPMGWSFFTDPAPIYRGDPMISQQLALRCWIEVYTSFNMITKMAWGARNVMAKEDSGKQDFGDDMKSAASDGLKKCATLLGIGNYIYRKHQSGQRVLSASADAETKAIGDQLKARCEQLGWTSDKFREFASGVVHKTVLGLGDLNPIQASAILTLMEELKGGHQLRNASIS